MRQSDCRQPFTHAARYRHAWGDCEGGMGVPPSRSIYARMGTFSEVPILAFKLSTLCRQLEGTRRKARPFFAVFLCFPPAGTFAARKSCRWQVLQAKEARSVTPPVRTLGVMRESLGQKPTQEQNALPRPSSASRGIGGCHLPPLGEGQKRSAKKHRPRVRHFPLNR